MNELSVKNEAIIDGELLLFRTLWHHSNDNMFIVFRDKNGAYVAEKSNSSLEKTFQIEPGQTDGIKLCDMLEEDIYAVIKSRYDACIRLNKTISYNETHTINKEEGARHWNTTIFPIVNADDGLVRIMGISKEITSIIKAERVLQEKQTILEAEVAKRTEALSQALKEMEKISNSDKLTGLCNRLKLDDILEKKMARMDKDLSFTLLMLDIDDFKEVNDTYGHQVGDRVLIEFAEVLRHAVRKTDTLGRWGGEEFMIICNDSDAEGVLKMAENIRKKLRAHDFKVLKKVTASYGISSYIESDTITTLIKRSDNALYEAKGMGKDRIVIN